MLITPEKAFGLFQVDAWTGSQSFLLIESHTNGVLSQKPLKETEGKRALQMYLTSKH